jgi:hypothetical protein
MRKANEMATIKNYLWQIQGEAREMALTARDRSVPAKALLMSAAFLGLFKLAVGVYCTLVSITAMQNVSVLRIP